MIQFGVGVGTVQVISTDLMWSLSGMSGFPYLFFSAVASLGARD